MSEADKDALNAQIIEGSHSLGSALGDSKLLFEFS